VSRDDGSRTLAHRLAYELFVGPIPDGLLVCHRCDNGRCINPAHLFLGTAAENIADAIQKGRFDPPLRRLTAEQVVSMRALRDRGWLMKDIAREFGVARNTASQAIRGVTWKRLHEYTPEAERAVS